MRGEEIELMHCKRQYLVSYRPNILIIHDKCDDKDDLEGDKEEKEALQEEERGSAHMIGAREGKKGYSTSLAFDTFQKIANEAFRRELGERGRDHCRPSDR